MWKLLSFCHVYQGSAQHLIRQPLVHRHTPTLAAILAQAVWWAVPKKKVSRHKKRLKNTVQNRIPLRRNIVRDARTGELTLKHRLPVNWRDYLPNEEEEEGESQQ